MALVPASFLVPEVLDTPHFRLRKLTFRDAGLDYPAVMANIDLIRRTRGGDWPTAALTFEDDQIDLAWHQREFERRASFAYIVLSPDETVCLGCVYLYPPGHRGAATADADVDVSFWVVKSAWDRGLYGALYAAIQHWLRDWPFERIAYSNAALP
jgi:RimJ/RimL family protein N-acetyltransferase